MQDLLNEEEFLPKEFNPTPWFRKFYLGALLFEIILIAMFNSIHLQKSTWVIILIITASIILPFAVALYMVFGKKEILLDTPKNKITASVIMVLGCFFVPNIFNAAYATLEIYKWENTIDKSIILIPLGIWGVLSVICLAVIFPLLNRSRKISRRLPQ